MVIVSQVRNYFVNFDNVETIGISKENEAYFIDCTYNDGNSTIGVYKTQERAEEVLQEIINLISKEDFYHIRKSELNDLDELAEPKYIIKPITKPKVYQMPEE